MCTLFPPSWPSLGVFLQNGLEQLLPNKRLNVFLSFFLVTSFCLESFYWTKIAAVVISYWTRTVYETWSWDLDIGKKWPATLEVIHWAQLFRICPCVKVHFCVLPCLVNLQSFLALYLDASLEIMHTLKTSSCLILRFNTLSTCQVNYVLCGLLRQPGRLCSLFAPPDITSVLSHRQTAFADVPHLFRTLESHIFFFFFFF